MGTVEVKTCDVYGRYATTKNPVERIEVRVAEFGPTGELLDEQPLFQCVRDLCPDALERLLKFVKRGTSKPNEI